MKQGGVAFGLDDNRDKLGAVLPLGGPDCWILAAIENENPWERGLPTRLLRPRVLVYGTLLLALIVGWTWGVTHRSPLIVEAIRDRNALYRVTADGVENVYTLKLVNKQETPQRYRITLLGDSPVMLPGGALEVDAEPGAVTTVPITLRAPAHGVHGRRPLTFSVQSLQDLRKLSNGLMVGLPVTGADRPDYLVRNIIGIDPQAGGIAIGAMVEEGDQLFFCRRDPDSAARDMDRMLADLKRRCGDRMPRGALWFSCMARCQDQFVQDPSELARIQAVFPDLPLVGMYCGGEIAQSRLYGYTGVLSLFL